MFCDKMNDNRLGKPNAEHLGIYMMQKTQSYEELLDLSGKTKIHTQNLKFLMDTVYKCLNNISLLCTWDYFQEKNNPYNNLRNTQLLELSKARLCGISCQIILRKHNPL